MSAQPAVDLEFLGRHAHAALDAARKHVEKAGNLRVTAGKDLIEAKLHVPHGSWLTYLAHHKISDRTARECMQLAGMKPEELEAFKANHAEGERERRHATKSAARAADLTSLPTAVGEQRRKAKATNVTDPEDLKLKQRWPQLTPELKREVIAFIESALRRAT